MRSRTENAVGMPVGRVRNEDCWWRAGHFRMRGAHQWASMGPIMVSPDVGQQAGSGAYAFWRIDRQRSACGVADGLQHRPVGASRPPAARRRSGVRRRHVLHERAGRPDRSSHNGYRHPQLLPIQREWEARVPDHSWLHRTSGSVGTVLHGGQRHVWPERLWAHLHLAELGSLLRRGHGHVPGRLLGLRPIPERLEATPPQFDSPGGDDGRRFEWRVEASSGQTRMTASASAGESSAMAFWISCCSASRMVRGARTSSSRASRA